MNKDIPGLENRIDNLSKERRERQRSATRTRRRYSKHSQLMSRRSQPQLSKKQRNKRQTKMEEVAQEPERKSSRAKTQTTKFDPIKEAERQRHLQTEMKEREAQKMKEEAESVAADLVHSLGIFEKDQELDVEIQHKKISKKLQKAVEDELFGESDYKNAYSSDENMGMGKGKKSKRRRRRHRGSKKNK